MAEEENAIVSRLGVTPEQLIGYVYSGILAVFIVTQVEPAFIKKTIDTTTALLFTIIALIIGIGLYVFYFRIIGEFVLYPFQHLVHWFVDRLRGKTGREHTSCVRYFGALGVPVGFRRFAYEAIMALFHSDDVRRRIQLQHGELHVLYLTAVEGFAAAAYLFFQGRDFQIWLVVGTVFFLGALLGDLRQHMLECTMIKAKGEQEVKKFLKDVGCLS